MELNLRNIPASFQTNMSPKHRIKRFKQQQRTLKNCYVIQVFQNHNWNYFKSFSSLSIRVFVCVYVLGGYFHTLFGGSFHCLNFGKFYDTAPLAQVSLGRDNRLQTCIFLHSLFPQYLRPHSRHSFSNSSSSLNLTRLDKQVSNWLRERFPVSSHLLSYEVKTGVQECKRMRQFRTQCWDMQCIEGRIQPIRLYELL